MTLSSLKSVECLTITPCNELCGRIPKDVFEVAKAKYTGHEFDWGYVVYIPKEDNHLFKTHVESVIDNHSYRIKEKSFFNLLQFYHSI